MTHIMLPLMVLPLYAGFGFNYANGDYDLHYPIADGDSHKAFIGESVQTIRTETARIPIKQKLQTIYTAGYSQKTENSKWSAAAEWNSATNAKGVSFAVELQIR